MNLIWTVHLGATLAMVGLIWFVQVVHYPIFARVEGPEFRVFHRDHTVNTGRVVVPLMLLELFSLVLLLWRPGTIQIAGLWSTAALLLLIWASTFWIQVPLHTRLATRPDDRTKRMLARTNWVRTGLWTARAVILLGLLSLQLANAGPAAEETESTQPAAQEALVPALESPARQV